ncbi:MAG: type II secretion system protein, partial [Tissierellales bacterium]
MFKFIQKQLKNKKGFTLVELVVVIAILGILAAIAVPKFASVTQNANKKAFEANHRTVVAAIQMYMAANNGDVPEAIDEDEDEDIFKDYIEGGLNSLTDKPVSG